MRTSLHTCALPVFLLGSAAIPSAALAQDALSAEALFNRGVEQMNAGDYEPGCKDIAESQRKEPLPGTLFSLATCMDRWGRIATAVALYGEYLAVYEKLPDDRKPRQGERPKVARAQREKLGPDVPELTLALPAGAPASTVVRRDGQEVAAATLGVASPVDPGEIVVTTQAPDGPVHEQRIAIGKGEKKTVTLEVKAKVVAPLPSAPPKPPAPPPAEGMSGQRKVAFALGGVGIAGLGLGGVLGALTLAEKSTLEEHCGAAIMAPEDRCDPTGIDAATRARARGLGSTISIAVGIAGLGAGVVLLLTDPAPSRPKAGTARRWIAAEVLSAGPDGALIGARGSF